MAWLYKAWTGGGRVYIAIIFRLNFWLSHVNSEYGHGLWQWPDPPTRQGACNARTRPKTWAGRNGRLAASHNVTRLFSYHFVTSTQGVKYKQHHVASGVQPRNGQLSLRTNAGLSAPTGQTLPTPPACCDKWDCIPTGVTHSPTPASAFRQQAHPESATIQ